MLERGNFPVRVEKARKLAVSTEPVSGSEVLCVTLIRKIDGDLVQVCNVTFCSVLDVGCWRVNNLAKYYFQTGDQRLDHRSGARISALKTELKNDFMGAEKYVQALGFQTMTATLTMAIHHPLLSSILEVSGSFNPPLHYVGVAAYLSAIILLLEPYIKRMDAARENLKQTK
ncbi:hypothetical protein Btru_048390 [Bulinus truncatus]|nr:hypothetical protein Btru_048390 [Bulinus truncatus]